MFDAEDDAPATKGLAFRGALLARQIVKLGELSGPLEFSMIRKLHREDFDQLVGDQVKVDQLGKSEPGG
jgi:phage FluMu protein gp41